MTLFDEVGAVALLCADREGARAWVRRVLGALADPEPATARLRETLQVFLATGGSLATTARRLQVHRNTVKYRVGRAYEVRGRPAGRLRPRPPRRRARAARVRVAGPARGPGRLSLATD